MSADLLDSPPLVEEFRRALLAWYAHHRRALPWRDAGDPYRVWLSEIMLQQTRVDQMGAYFERFVTRFPDLAALAAAPEDEVLKAWEGLGYYARARNLHRAARRMVAEHGGRVPERYADLLALPGVGPYTAAAVSSIAFDGDHPVLDGNVTRVLCRLLRVEEEPRRAAVRARLIAAGERLLAPARAGDFNQAMMELGATVCTPARPGCDRCPVADLCRARQELDDPARLPLKVPRPPRPHFEVTAGLIWKGRRLLLAQRPPGGMLGGLWEFPGGKQEAGETLEDCLAREIREELDVEIEVGEHLVSVDHGYTHLTITLHAFEARYAAGTPRAIGCAAWQWVAPGRLDEFAMPRADRLILERLSRREDQLRLFPRAGKETS
ncbi:MAG: A/G-specific adenine glycosylase [Gemmatimonadota bacterium]